MDFFFVRYILEYGVFEWHPFLAKDHSKMERVQNRFVFYVVYILKIKHLYHNYSLILNTLRIPLFFSQKLTTLFVYLLTSSLDISDLISIILFCTSFHITRYYLLFPIPTRPMSNGYNHTRHRVLCILYNLNLDTALI